MYHQREHAPKVHTNKALRDNQIIRCSDNLKNNMNASRVQLCIDVSVTDEPHIQPWSHNIVMELKNSSDLMTL